jgi:hypothetical protein
VQLINGTKIKSEGVADKPTRVGSTSWRVRTGSRPAQTSAESCRSLNSSGSLTPYAVVLPPRAAAVHRSVRARWRSRVASLPLSSAAGMMQGKTVCPYRWHPTSNTRQQRASQCHWRWWRGFNSAPESGTEVMYMMTVDTRWSFILLSTCTVEMGSSPLLLEERESENASARDGRCARNWNPVRSARPRHACEAESVMRGRKVRERNINAKCSGIG